MNQNAGVVDFDLLLELAVICSSPVDLHIYRNIHTVRDIYIYIYIHNYSIQIHIDIYDVSPWPTCPAKPPASEDVSFSMQVVA